MTADAGYHSEANLKALVETSVEAYNPDNGYRKRDERYAGPSTPPSLIRSGTKPRRLHRRTSSWRRIAHTAPAPLESGSMAMVRTAHSMGLRRSSFAERNRIASPVRGGRMFAHPGEDKDPTGRLLSGQTPRAYECHRPDKDKDQLGYGPTHDYAQFCHREAGIWQPTRE